MGSRMRIYDKISDRVKLEKKGKKYIVSQISKKTGEWHQVYSTSSISKALHRKHNAMRMVIKDLGYLPLLLERIKKRKTNSYHKKVKKRRK